MSALDEDRPVSLYPVCLTARGFDIWIAWRSVDDSSEAVLKRDGLLLWATSRGRILEKCRMIFPASVFLEDYGIDLDDLLERLEGMDVSRAEIALNAWNMLSDIENSIYGRCDSNSMIMDQRYMDSYDRLFSSTSAGRMVDFDAGAVDAADLKNAALVISQGVRMLLSAAALDGLSSSGDVQGCNG